MPVCDTCGTEDDEDFNDLSDNLCASCWNELDDEDDE